LASDSVYVLSVENAKAIGQADAIIAGIEVLRYRGMENLT